MKPNPEVEIDFTNATRKLLFGAQRQLPTNPIPGAGTSAARTPSRHTRVKITINLDGDLIEQFKERGEEQGVGYQFLINQALREYLEGTRTERLAREIGELLLANESFQIELAEKIRAKDSPLTRVK